MSVEAEPTASAPGTGNLAAEAGLDERATADGVADRVAPPRNFTVSASGDILIHRPVWRSAAAHAAAAGRGEAYDFGPIFGELEPHLRDIDVAICHLETPVALPGNEPSTSPLYGAPPELIAGIAGAGFDRCSIASNHTLDQGVAGIDHTLALLDRHGVGHSGAARTPDEAQPRPFDVTTPSGNVAVAHLSYTFSFNGLRLPADQPWRSNLIDADRIRADVVRVRAAGAEVVIVSMHWGIEGANRPSAAQRALADTLTSFTTPTGGIDLIIGHHAHVLQPIERVNGVWVLWSLSNLVSNLPTTERVWPAIGAQDAALVEFEFSVDSDGDVTVTGPTVVPTWVDKYSGHVIRDVVAHLTDPSAQPPAGYYERSFERTASILSPFVTRS